MRTNEIIVCGVVTVLGVAAIGYSEYKRKKLDEAVNKLSHNVKFDVEDPYIREIVDKAVEYKLDYKIDKACNDAVTAVKYDITKEVKKSVNEAYKDTKVDVKKELKKQVGEVDIEGIRQEVIDEAKTAAADKFKDDLNTVLAGYNADLENIRKIYSGIAQTINQTQQKPTITFG